MTKTIKERKCSSCVWKKEDKTMSTFDKYKNKWWTAYQCTNSLSQYWGAILNINLDGDLEHIITWEGCKFYEKEEDKN